MRFLIAGTKSFYFDNFNLASTEDWDILFVPVSVMAIFHSSDVVEEISYLNTTFRNRLFCHFLVKQISSVKR